MKVHKTTIHSESSATIILRPSWLARLCGAKDLVCELERRGARKAHDIEEGPVGWRSKFTGEQLHRMSWGGRLKEALEFQPYVGEPPVDEAGVVSLPRAKVRK